MYESTDWLAERFSYFISQRPLGQSLLCCTIRPSMQWTAVGQLDYAIQGEDDRRCYSSQRDMLCLHLKSHNSKLLGFQVLWRANFIEGRGKNETTDHFEHLLILELAFCSPLNRLLTAGSQAHQVKQTKCSPKNKLNIPTAVVITQRFRMLSDDGQIQTTKSVPQCVGVKIHLICIFIFLLLL